MTFSDRDVDRLDLRLLKAGAVTLYWRRELLERDAAWLANHGYQVHWIDCTEPAQFRAEMSRAVGFQELFGYRHWTGNLDALHDGLGSLQPLNQAGIAFCFLHFDRLVAADRPLAQGVLDVMEWNSRDRLLLGGRLLALVQSDDSTIALSPVGARPVIWNQDEWLNANRR